MDPFALVLLGGVRARGAAPVTGEELAAQRGEWRPLAPLNPGMARCLIVGCGCRGIALARGLIDGGYAVRGSTRDPARLAAIEAAGVEPVIGDPDRVVTLVSALEQVTVACVLLASARGTPEEIAALHGPRLQMLLQRMLDTTIRGIVYEAAGSVHSEVLASGAGMVREFCEDSRIPCAILRSKPGDHTGWLAAASEAVFEVLRG